MNWRNLFRAFGTGGVAGAAFLALSVSVHGQQTGTVEGVLTDASTQRVLAGAIVDIPDTQIQALTSSAGRYTLQNVPAGTHTVRAQLIGYAEMEQTVSVVAGETVTLNMRMTPTAIALREVVVTGVAEATPRAKLPFTVNQLRAEDLPVPAASAASAIQGKVAGAQVVQGSGRPGSPPSILLRGPTSINASGRDQEPMYIVDGVILGASMVDIDALDIDDIEIVKGAAASSLYGSRAANGVVNITTRRGARLEEEQVRYSVRSEIGQSELEGRFNLAQRHAFAMDDQNRFLTSAGEPCEWLECPNVALAGQMARGGESPGAWNTVQSQTWPQTFDNVDRFFDPGTWMQNYASAEGRSGRTNFHVSMQNLQESGVLPGQDGRDRTNFRLNLDQEVRDNVQVSASAFYSTSSSDLIPETQGNPIFNLTRMPAGVDLLATDPEDPDDRVILNPDPFRVDNTNPLNDMLYREWSENRNRFLGSANVRFSPTHFLSLDANVSYDRLNQEDDTRVPRGFRTGRPTATLNDGWVSRENLMEDALNTSVTATLRQRFGDDLTGRAQFRYLLERNDVEWSSVSGYRFAADQVYTIGNTDPETRSGTSGVQREIAEGLFATVNLDFRDRYIVDALVRRDGSSLFGPDERENWYYRIAGAYLISEEDWFDISGVDLFKLRYSLGTAGTRPHWAAQYETYSVAAGVIQPLSLGNRALRPEFSTEHEIGLELDALERFTLGLTYADVTTEEQILPVPAPAYGGFAHQWQNAGTLSSNTWEASLNARLVETPDLSWSTRIQFDRTRQQITDMAVPPFTYGVSGQNLGNVFQARQGERLGTFYGIQFAESCTDLPTGFTAASCEAFRVNDDGFLVWVGDAGSYRDGWEDRGDGRNHWGTLAPFTIQGEPVFWGTPISGWREDPLTGEETNFLPLGNTLPDFSVSLSSTVSFGGFSLYGLIDAVQGQDIYNQPLQWAVFQHYGGIVDQAPDAPPEEQKPLGYYDFLYGTSGLMPSSRFVEDGSFTKLREVSLSYRIGQDRLGTVGLRAVSGATLSLVGRNLFTWSNYDGYDPEVGRRGGETGSAALARVDGFNYPNFRTFTLGIELNF